MAVQWMSRYLWLTSLVVVLMGLVPRPVVHAQQTAPPAPPLKAPEPTTMVGCISTKPEASGQYTFAGSDGRAQQIDGKGIRKFAGRRVELVLGPPGKGLTVRPGLWPPPSGGARGVALDPSQEAILRQPGGGGAGVGAGEDVVFVVSRVRSVPGACK
jgi:hypothetical protein